MDIYRHHVSGHFAQREDAQNAISNMVELGLPRERIQLLDTDSGATACAPKAHGHEVVKKIFMDGAIGSAVGLGIGALAGLSLVAASISLFVASPLITALALLGWGASLGGMVGAATGADSWNRWWSVLVRDANPNRQLVLVVKTRSERETAIAREGLQASVGDYPDIRTV